MGSYVKFPDVVDLCQCIYTISFHFGSHPASLAGSSLHCFDDVLSNSPEGKSTKDIKFSEVVDIW